MLSDGVTGNDKSGIFGAKTMWIVLSASAPKVRVLLSGTNHGIFYVGFGRRRGLTR